MHLNHIKILLLFPKLLKMTKKVPLNTEKIAIQLDLLTNITLMEFFYQEKKNKFYNELNLTMLDIEFKILSIILIYKNVQ